MEAPQTFNSITGAVTAVIYHNSMRIGFGDSRNQRILVLRKADMLTVRTFCFKGVGQSREGHGSISRGSCLNRFGHKRGISALLAAVVAAGEDDLLSIGCFQRADGMRDIDMTGAGALIMIEGEDDELVMNCDEILTNFFETLEKKAA